MVFPMGEHNDPLLSYLRRGEYPVLTRFDSLGRGLFAGSKVDITAAVKQALSNPELQNAKDFISAVKPETFEIDPKHDSLAYYSKATVKDKYAKIADEVNEGGAKGLVTLNKLIVSHLVCFCCPDTPASYLAVFLTNNPTYSMLHGRIYSQRAWRFSNRTLNI